MGRELGAVAQRLAPKPHLFTEHRSKGGALVCVDSVLGTGDLKMSGDGTVSWAHNLGRPLQAAAPRGFYRCLGER